MGTKFCMGDKVRILEGNDFDNETGIIIKDGGFQNLGVRKLGESKYNTSLHQWIVKLDSTGSEVPFFDGALEKIA